MNIDFKGKKALVTGAGRGIGKEIVRLLVQCNAQVVAVTKTQANLDELKVEFPAIETVCLDVSNWNATKEALGRLNDIELLVNNAAVAICEPIGQISEQSVDTQYNVNVKAVINVTQTLAEGMKKRKSGSIVNLSSMAGIVGLADHLVYGGTKAALDLMTKVMALELGPYNIRVNSVNPTVVWTEMAQVGWSDPEKARRMVSKIPLNRFIEPVEVARAVVYLLSDQSTMISGTILPIDGGATASSP